MKKAAFYIAVFFFVMIFACICLADDVAMYSSTNIKPNVLIIFDNSGSMAAAAPYDSNANYRCGCPTCPASGCPSCTRKAPTCPDCPSCTPCSPSCANLSCPDCSTCTGWPSCAIFDTNTIYKYTCTKSSWWSCQTYEWDVYTGTYSDPSDTGCDQNNPYGSTNPVCRGNWLNFHYGPQTDKISAAQNAINSVITASENYARFGVMVLNAGQDINGGATYPNYHNDKTVLSSSYGGALIQDRNTTGGTTDVNSIAYLESQISNSQASGGTPLANRLIQAAKYFKGTFPNPSGGNYPSPIDAINWCRQNFVIIITDGQPEAEGDSYTASHSGDFDDIEGWMDANAKNANGNSCRDCDNDGADPATGASGMTFVHGGSHYLDDIAYHLYNTTDSIDPKPNGVSVNGDQNLTIYTIGFTEDDQLLEHTATNAGGKYYTCGSPTDLAYRLNQVMQEIIEQTQIYTAPVVPVQRSVSGNKMYISLFTPQSHANFWPGYLIKLYIGSDGNLYGNDQITRATDADDNLLLTPLLSTSGSPQPYWEAQKALKGMNSGNLALRNIYTYVGTSAHLNNSTNLFVATNANITYAMLGSPLKQSYGDPSYPGTAGARHDLMQYIRGYDSYDQNFNGVYNEQRQYILGDIIHSKPLIINYGSNGQVVYVGTNDGMLHALNDADGTEKWTFIAPDLLPNLNNMIVGSSHQYYCDGSPMAYIKDVNNNGIIESGDQVIIIFGERGGGSSYTALDVTNPDDPQYLWRIDNATISGIPAPTTVISELGQSWSEPQIGKVKVGTTDTVVAFIGGGYSPGNTNGRGFFIINVLTGALVKSFTISGSGVLANMTFCIPSTPLAVDTNFDGYINRVYVGDNGGVGDTGTGGQMWRFGNQAGTEDGNVNNWTPRLLFRGLSGTKIFYSPDLVLEPGYAYLYFGTGDRMNPMYLPTYSDRIYAVKDKNETDAAFQARLNPVGVLTESNLVDVTQDLLQNPSTSQSTINNIQSQLTSMDGWFIGMGNTAEKALAPPVAISGDVIFTTFTPNNTVCSSGGDARIYAVDYLTAKAVWDLNTTNTGLQQSDRSQIIGTGIPTEPVVVIGADGIARVYVAVGGKIVLLDESPSTVGFTVDSWRETF